MLNRALLNKQMCFYSSQDAMRRFSKHGSEGLLALPDTLRFGRAVTLVELNRRDRPDLT